MLIGSCHWTKQTIETEQCVQLQGKFKIKHDKVDDYL